MDLNEEIEYFFIILKKKKSRYVFKIGEKNRAEKIIYNC